MMSNIFSIVVSNVFFATALALVAVVVTRFWRSPQLSHALWGLVLIKLITPPLAVVSIPEGWLGSFSGRQSLVTEVPTEDFESRPFAHFQPPASVTDPFQGARMSEAPFASAPTQMNVLDDATQSLGVNEPAGSAESVVPAVDPHRWSLFQHRAFSLLRSNWPLVVGSIWGLGTLVYTLVMIYRFYQFKRVLKAASEAPSEVYLAASEFAAKLGLCRCPPIHVVDAPIPPLVWSLGWRPIVLLPSGLIDGLQEPQRDAVIAHELAHVRRRDDLVRWLEVVALFCCWWNPLAWLARNKLREAEEECCDAWVVWILPNERRSYGEALLKTIEFLSNHRCAVPVLTGSTFGNSCYKRRFEMIIKRNVSRNMSWPALAFVIAIAVCILPAAAQTDANDTRKETEKADTLVAGNVGSEQVHSDVPETGLRPGDQERQLIVEGSDRAVRRGPVQRGEGQSREMLLHGRVLRSNGNPARDFRLTARVDKSNLGRDLLSTKVDGDRFEVWIPVGRPHWPYVKLGAESSDGESRVFRAIRNRELRAAAVDGVELRLAPKNRVVGISVKHGGLSVANAHVSAQLGGTALLTGNTDSYGKVAFRLCEGESLSRLTAWTDDFRIGGYSFNRKPHRDPLGTDFTIDLEDCREQTVRFLDSEDNSPVANVPFELVIGTGQPNFNFVAAPATFPYCRMTTDASGQARQRWFPIRKTRGAYVEIVDTRWVSAVSKNAFTIADDGALVMALKRSVSRKPFIGRVTSNQHDVGGLLVEIKSFQGEENWSPDSVYAFTDTDGGFTAECIPGATYTVCVNDGRLASRMIDLIPHEPDTGKSNFAELEVREGRPIEIRVTSGALHEPMPNQVVYVRQSHQYTWLKNGARRSGNGARDFPVYTDKQGVAHAQALAGSKLRITVFAGEWRSVAQNVTVKEEGVTLVEIHREIDAEREVTGRLLAPPGVDVELAGTQIVYGSIDGATDERETIIADVEGRFAFKTKAAQLGIFAYTADGTAAGIAKPASINGLIELQLNPTMDLRGQLLGLGVEPLANHAVRVKPRVRGKHAFGKSLATSFEAKTFETTTDADGRYTLENLPTELVMTLRADSITGSKYEARLDEFRLVAGVNHPTLVSRLDRNCEPDNCAPKTSPTTISIE